MTSSVFRIKFYRADPLLKFFIDSLRLNWWRIMIAYLVFWLVETVLYAYLFGLFPSRLGVFGFLDDLPGQIAVVLWAGAIILAYYVWGGTIFTSLLWQLHREGSMFSGSSQKRSPLAEKDYLWAVDKLEKLWNKRIWVLLAFLISTGWWLFTFSPFWGILLQDDYWHAVYPVYQMYSSIKMLIWTYIVVRVLIIEVLGLYSLFQLVYWRVLVYQALHPDRAGGLLAIGKYRLGLVYAMVGVSFSFIFIAFQESFGYTPTAPVLGSLNVIDLIIILLFIALIPVSFFGAISKTHSFMKQNKSELILSLTSEIDRDIDINNRASLESRISNFNNVSSLVNTLSKAPVWPYNTSVLGRFLGAWGSFVIGLLLAVSSDLIIDWLR